MKETLQKFSKISVAQNILETTFNQIPLVLSLLILDKDNVSKNSDLKPFANKIGNTQYRDYLFQSRTSLFARLVKDVFINSNSDGEKKRTIESIQDVIRTIQESEESTESVSLPKKKKASAKKESPTEKWQRIIEAE